jgi:AraC-like DNA-binding protein
VVQHVEFFDKAHFAFKYHRKTPKLTLGKFIDFFWETDFDDLYPSYPQGFSDVLFPNVGYTYLINLGTPFIMQLDEEAFEMKSDGFLPRHKNIACHHAVGNKIFGIKFKVSPLIFEKKINFAEYREYIFPLAYLIDRKIVQAVKSADTFAKRVDIISAYYNKILEQHEGSLQYVHIVAKILEDCFEHNDFNKTVEELAKQYKVSTRTLQRYFEACTSISSKQALQIMRVRKAVAHLTEDPATFHYSLYGYYDYSHFYKHVKQFLGKAFFAKILKQLSEDAAPFKSKMQAL